MADAVLIQEKADPARYKEWKGADGVPEIATVKMGVATSSLVTVDTVQTVLAANPSRNKMVLQNVSTQAIHVKLGAGASTTDFSFILQAGAASRDGKGGVFTDDCYTGVVTAVAAVGTGNQLAASEY